MADKQITPFQLTDQFTMDNFNQRINETNIALQKMVNPNLLDNWYFSNPVDQRGGYVVPPGTDYYYIGGETVAGTTAAYYTVKSVDTNGNATFAIDGTDYWCIGKGVRGYTGGGYGIDRWKQLYDSTYCLIQDGYVSFYGTDFGQMIETKIIPLNTPLTYSVLTAEGILGSITFQFDGTQSQTTFGLIGETKFRANFIYNWGNTYTPFFLQTEENVINVVAMKLELGSQQTLAHQDADGNWVLNEIPDYGEQLARCQRYFRRIKAKQVYSSGVMFSFPIVDVGGATWANINVILSTMMRDAKPSVSFHGLSVADYVSTQSRGSISDNAERNVIYYTGDTVKLSINTGITLTDTDAIMMASEGYIDIINDL